MQDTHREMCDFYLDRFRDGDRDSAFFGLIEASNGVIPILLEKFRTGKDSAVRDFLVRVIREHRNPETIPFLAEALHDWSPAVWKQAHDGLVILGTPEAQGAITSARTRRFASGEEQRDFQEWIDEALGQMNSVD